MKVSEKCKQPEEYCGCTKEDIARGYKSVSKVEVAGDMKDINEVLEDDNES